MIWIAVQTTQNEDIENVKEECTFAAQQFHTGLTQLPRILFKGFSALNVLRNWPEPFFIIGALIFSLSTNILEQQQRLHPETAAPMWEIGN